MAGGDDGPKSGPECWGVVGAAARGGGAAGGWAGGLERPGVGLSGCGARQHGALQLAAARWPQPPRFPFAALAQPSRAGATTTTWRCSGAACRRRWSRSGSSWWGLAGVDMRGGWAGSGRARALSGDCMECPRLFLVSAGSWRGGAVAGGGDRGGGGARGGAWHAARSPSVLPPRPPACPLLPALRRRPLPRRARARRAASRPRPRRAATPPASPASPPPPPSALPALPRPPRWARALWAASS